MSVYSPDTERLAREAFDDFAFLVELAGTKASTWRKYRKELAMSCNTDCGRQQAMSRSIRCGSA